MTKDDIATLLTNEIAAELGTTPDNVDEYTSFMRLGVSSVQALKIVNRLRKQLSISINPVALFEFNTVDEISSYLAEEYLALA